MLNMPSAAWEMKKNIFSVYKDKRIVSNNNKSDNKIFYNDRIVCAVECVNDRNCCGTSHNVSINICYLYLKASELCSYTIETSLGWNVLHKDGTKLDCYLDESRNYNGYVNYTNSRKTCQMWNLQSPHTHKITSQMMSDFNSNYCRDPDDTLTPWCYTTDPSVRWEFCPVAKC
ncbi:PLG [Mytilus coruscus]|uniref:PLG n=1 Tax=Mytilus coruscus TaxID=42192 RepID=A0A6J8D8P8_MYTCO|nr:PLG [Mytilus coruscus]